MALGGDSRYGCRFSASSAILNLKLPFPAGDLSGLVACGFGANMSVKGCV
jgi:hypothetical protein